MRKLKVKGKLDEGELKRRYLTAEDKRERTRWQVLWLVKGVMSVREVSKVVGRSEKSVRKWIKWYNESGENRIKGKPHKGREPFLKDNQFNRLDKLVGQPPTKGSRWTGCLIKEKIAEMFKVEYSLNGVYKILHRRLFGLKSPRPEHPKANKIQQGLFKKSSVIM